MKTKILHVVRQYDPGVGGIETFVRDLVAEQVKAGLRPDVLTLDRVFSKPRDILQKYEQREGYNIHRIPYYGSRRYPIAPTVLTKISGYDIIHVHGVDFFVDFLSLTRFVHKKPIVLSTHGGFFHTSFARRFKRLYFHTVTRFTLLGIRRVFASSKNDLETFQGITSKVELVENGVDVNAFSGPEIPRINRMIYVGRMASHKRVGLLLDVVQEVARRRYSVELFLVGPDWDGTGTVVASEIDKRDLANIVKMKGSVSKNELVRMLRSSKVFVSASEYEGFGLSLVEAMAAGVFPIVNSITSFIDILEGRTGTAISYKDISSVVDEITRILSLSDDEFERVSKEVTRDAQVYSWINVHSKFLAEYSRRECKNIRATDLP